MKTTTATKPTKSTGHIKLLSFDTTSPVPFKLQDIEFNKISLFVGANGSGKTFILICAYAMSMIANMITMMRPPMDFLVMSAQQIFDRCFKDQNIDGMISVTFEAGCSLTIKFDKGVVTNAIIVSGFEDITEAVAIQYMSSAMRTFSAISHYLQLKHMTQKANPSLDPAMIHEKMCESYRLYDVMYVETLIQRMPIKINKDLVETLKKFNIEGIEEIAFVDNDFVAHTDKGPKALSSYSAGDQSILNMIIGQI